VLAARGYRRAFVQRGLFPYYPDQRSPHLERLLARLVPERTIDFYDADYVPSPVIVEACVPLFDRVTVVGAHIEKHFASRHTNVRVFPLCVRIDEYAAKASYVLGKPPTLLWMGSVGNASRLRAVEVVLRELSRSRPFRLVVVCRRPVDVPGVDVDWRPWTESTAHDLVPGCDIAIYPAEDSEADRGKMALKVLEYMAAALPTVASPYGLPPCAVEGETVAIALDAEGWRRALIGLLDSQELRERLGRAARAAVMRHHAVDVVYPQFKEHVLGPRESA
jgi:glycosyltransferase involved in cell wall biosynthesis